VNLINLASNLIRSTTTDNSGKYELVNLPSGLYRVVVKALGYNDFGRTITVSGGPVTQNVELAPGTISEVMTVTAARGLAAEQDIPSNVTAVTSESIEARVPTSVADVIKNTPSLFIFNPGAHLGTPNLRGLQSSRVLLVVDGERVNNSRTEIQTFGAPLGSFIDTFYVENAEVVAGAGSSLYGTDSLVGTVNFTTKEPFRSNNGWIVGTRLQGLYSHNEDGRKGAVTLNISNPWIAFNLFGSLYRYGYYHFGDTGGDVPLRAIQIQQDLFKRLRANNGDRIDFELSDAWPRQSLLTSIGVPANATQSTVFNSQSHGANGFFNLWLYPNRKHTVRYKQFNIHLGAYGYPNESPPHHTEYQFADFEKTDRYGVRYQGVELNPVITRVAAGFYYQKLIRPINALTFFRTSPPRVPGAATPLDTFIRPSALTFAKQAVTTKNFDAQVSLLFHPTNTLLAGFQVWRDTSADELLIWSYNSIAGAPGRILLPWSPIMGGFTLSGQVLAGKGNPDGFTQETAVFFQDNYDPVRWLRLEASYRFSRFKTKYFPSDGFPLPGFDIAINGPFPAGINPNGAEPFAPVINGTGPVSFPEDVHTGSFAVIGRPLAGVSVFGRVGNSFRQPAIIERGLFRGFPAGNFAFIFTPNGNLVPERAVNVDTGVKINHRLFRASATYFNNTYTNFIEQTPILLQPGGPGSLAERLGFQFLFWLQRFNTGRARIHGLETDFDVPVDLAGRAVLTFSGAMSWEHGEDLAPLSSFPQTFQFLERQHQENLAAGKEFFEFGERTLDANNSPVFSDVPFERIVPFLASWFVRLEEKSSRFWTEYSGRGHSRIKRLDPDLQGNQLRFNYWAWASFAGAVVHNWRFGYNLLRENSKVSLTLSLDNIGNKFYVEPFQRGAARGRSVIFGFNIESFDILRYFK
jgi:hemoglobin/transferrin/lactoferrin receptor protein